MSEGPESSVTWEKKSTSFLSRISIRSDVAFFGLSVILMQTVLVMLARGYGLDFIMEIIWEHDEISVACTEI